ncbi:pyruvate dehydrogenase complex dihydrolipoamide acetyltransferase [Puniceibacterium sp. IMCC21224]|uniref:pyruvate dehydrogenase complex dihydrolipoamide acetyltransferase n=1 Tax=Puniceibacterium sp. IMCC21224 TaxID=1618204 RepID=UPI00064DFB38|nr:pyruvate dehydrogenase complex dihydrolipoamide acetyltransferase [Puniceibacterium sp. IMCC21224]KMK66974.1 pyruvate dehydrogenase complex dihydrolipoamide acetyltransferase, long form [Puniceibacterium sp. IMCC21224]
MPVEILMPALSPTMEEGTLAKWLVRAGDSVTSGDVIAEIETDKATMEFEAVDDGTISQILIAAGTAGVAVNTPIAVLLADGDSAESSAPTVPDAPPLNAPPSAPTVPGTQDAATPSSAKRIFASPLARRIAVQKGVDLGQIVGSGPHGRIVRADVEGAAPAGRAPETKISRSPAGQDSAVQPQASEVGDIAALYAKRDYTEIQLDGMRRTIAARLTQAKQTIPHFYLRRDIRLDALLSFRTEINRQLEKRGIRLSVNDFIIKACALALQQVPAANAVWAGDRILQLTPSDVAVAVAIDGGLFTPVLQDAHQKSLTALSAEIKDLAARARDRKLAPHEYQGGSFAISNLGMFGVKNFDAVINPPHGAILAVGAGIRQPVVTAQDELGIATVMSVTLSVDHRVIDGALAAELLSAIVENLEHPIAMLV